MPSINFPELKMPKINFDWLNRSSSVKKEVFTQIVIHIKHGYFDKNGLGFLNHFNGHTLIEIPLSPNGMPLTTGSRTMLLGGKFQLTPRSRFIFDFQNGDVPLNKPASRNKGKNELKTEWLSQGRVSKLGTTVQEQIAITEYMIRARLQQGYTKIEISVTKEQYNKLFDAMTKSYYHPPKYGFTKTRCAGWASERLREAGIFNQFSRLFSWSPLPLRFAIRIGLKFGTDAKVLEHTKGKF